MVLQMTLQLILIMDPITTSAGMTLKEIFLHLEKILKVNVDHMEFSGQKEEVLVLMLVGH